MWLSLDNTEVKKANMSGMFRVNLAFYRNINTSKCVDYNIDFVAIKQGCARRRPSLLVKSHPKYSGQNGKGKKSSMQPQLSIPDDPSKEFVGEGPILQNEVSAWGTGHIQPETSETTCPNANASVPLRNVDTLPTIHDTVGTKSSEVKNHSDNDKSQSNTHKEALHANPSEKEDSTFHDNPKAKGGCSAADMPPLQFKKRIVVDIEKYPNLLKRFQAGKVKVYVSRTEDERLNTIRQKVISKVAFNKYLSKTVDETENLQKQFFRTLLLTLIAVMINLLDHQSKVTIQKQILIITLQKTSMMKTHPVRLKSLKLPMKVITDIFVIEYFKSLAFNNSASFRILYK